jgi:2'-5' RNA ligase
VRLFIAVNLPDAEKERLWHALASLRERDLGVRWIPRDAIHLTLKFLGEVGESRVDRVSTRLAGVAARHAPFELRLAGIGGFPTLDRAKVWWLGIEPDERLMNLQAEVEEALVDEGFAREDRPFTAHVTIGRAARGGRPADARVARAAAAGIEYEAAWAVSSADLMRSHLGRDGARYEILFHAPLGAPAAPRRQGDAAWR